MFHSSRAIVFHQTRYSDTSLVVKILTEDSGLGSYIIKGARGPKAKIKSSLFQPLTLLDLVVSIKEKSDLHHIREARVAHLYKTIPTDIRKSSILLFLNELLYKSIQEEVVNEELFRFIFDHLVLLDEMTESPSNFHVLFAIHLTHFLGFFPQGKYVNEHTVFDLVEGHFSQAEPMPADHFISGKNCYWFSKLLETPPDRSHTLTIPAQAKNELIEKILIYYQMHLPIAGTFKSHIVLHEVLQN
jgi:DNA repair protein RecO (recombination protein O)